MQFGRGSNSPGDAVFGGQKAIGVGTAGSAVSTSPVTFAIGAGHPFMADRAAIERWKQTFALYFAEARGDPTPGVPGLHPGA